MSSAGNRVLDPAVYWRLRYLQTAAELADAKQKLATDRAWTLFRAALTEAQVPIEVPFSWRDADTTLVAPPAET